MLIDINPTELQLVLALAVASDPEDDERAAIKHIAEVAAEACQKAIHATFDDYEGTPI